MLRFQIGGVVVEHIDGDPKSNAQVAIADARQALENLVDWEPRRHPLVIAFAAPVGTRLDPILTEIRTGLSSYGYGVETISLASLLDGVPRPPWGKLPPRGSDGYYESRMNAGDQLRRETDLDAVLAGMAVSRLSELRQTQQAPTAYILRSLKHPDEADLLRHIYGDAFGWLPSLAAPKTAWMTLQRNCLERERVSVIAKSMRSD